MAGARDWFAVTERLLEGDRVALLELGRLVNTYLSLWNAYDFNQEWDDIIQEVVIVAAVAVREGRVRERAAFAGYVRTIARNKFVNRLKTHLRLREDKTQPWEDVIDGGGLEMEDLAPELRRDLLGALDRLPAKKREAVCAVYLEGKTYAEAAEATGLPLGTLKRYLGEGIAQLRKDLSDSPRDDPIRLVERTDSGRAGSSPALPKCGGNGR